MQNKLSPNLEIAKEAKERRLKNINDIRTIKKPKKEYKILRREGKIRDDMKFEPAPGIGGTTFSEKIIRGMLKDSTTMGKLKRIYEESKKEVFGE